MDCVMVDCAPPKPPPWRGRWPQAGRGGMSKVKVNREKVFLLLHTSLSPPPRGSLLRAHRDAPLRPFMWCNRRGDSRIAREPPAPPFLLRGSQASPWRGSLFMPAPKEGTFGQKRTSPHAGSWFSIAIFSFQRNSAQSHRPRGRFQRACRRR